MEILKYPHPALTTRAKPVETVDEEVRAMAAGMLEAMVERRGIGLAGPQVGYLKRLIVINITPQDKEADRAYVNPVVVWSEGEATAEEGCLSLPGVNGKVTRAAKVRVEALDLEGKKVTVEAEGLHARALQHEIDHLDGNLIMSRFSAVDKAANARILRDMEKMAKAKKSKAGRI